MRARQWFTVVGLALVLSLLAFGGPAWAHGGGPTDGGETPAAPAATDGWLQWMQEWMGPEAWGQMIQWMTRFHGPEFTGQMLQWMDQTGGCHGDGLGGLGGRMGGLFGWGFGGRMGR